jgi:hypothetical protein
MWLHNSEDAFNNLILQTTKRIRPKYGSAGINCVLTRQVAGGTLTLL